MSRLLTHEQRQLNQSPHDVWVANYYFVTEIRLEAKSCQR